MAWELSGLDHGAVFNFQDPIKRLPQHGHLVVLNRLASERLDEYFRLCDVEPWRWFHGRVAAGARLVFFAGAPQRRDVLRRVVVEVSLGRDASFLVPVWKSINGAFALNRRVDLHAIDATPCTRRTG